MNETKKIKVIEIIPQMEVAGAQRVVTDIALNINHDLFDIYVLAYVSASNHFVESLQKSNISVKFIDIKGKNFLLRKIMLYCSICKRINEFNPDVIHVHLDYKYFWLYSLLHHRRFIETIHSQAFRISNCYTKLVYPLLAKQNLIKLVLLSKNNVKEFNKIFHIKNNDWTIISNPIYINKALTQKKREDNCVVFTNIARFEKIKNHKLLIDSFYESFKINNNIRLYLVGEGEELKIEKKHVRDLKLSGVVKFFGVVSDVHSVLSISDVFVLPSKTECFPVTLLEAMSHGLPIIASDIGGCKDIVKDNGILVKPNDKEKLKQAILQIASDTNKRNKMSEKSRKLIRQYNKNDVIKLYEKLYYEEAQIHWGKK